MQTDANHTTHGHDPHVAWRGRITAIRSQLKRVSPEDDATREALMDELWQLHKRLCSTAATSYAGAAAQIQEALDTDAGGSILSELEVRALRLVLQLLKRLG